MYDLVVSLPRCIAAMVKMTPPPYIFKTHTHSLSLLCIPHPKTSPPPFPSLSFFLSCVCVCVCFPPPSFIPPPPSTLFFPWESLIQFFIFYFWKTIKRSTTETHTQTHSKTTLLNMSTHFHDNSSGRNQLLLLLLLLHHHHCRYSCLLLIKINIFCVFLFVVF